MSITSNVERIGSFTSSEIYRLVSYKSREMTDDELADHKKANPKSKKRTVLDWPGDTALSYIEEKRFERKLGRSISMDSKARALTWGKTVEQIAFGKLPFEYELTSTQTIPHLTIPYWFGSPDGFSSDAVIDIKCPITLKSFCQFIECIELVEVNGVWVMDQLATITKIRANHPDGEKYYWQLVSNAALSYKSFAELIVYCPYQSDLLGIKVSALDEPGANWIHYADDSELPFLIEGGNYQDINIIRFPVPQSDIDLLTDCVLRAGALLNA